MMFCLMLNMYFAQREGAGDANRVWDGWDHARTRRFAAWRVFQAFMLQTVVGEALSRIIFLSISLKNCASPD